MQFCADIDTTNGLILQNGPLRRKELLLRSHISTGVGCFFILYATGIPEPSDEECQEAHTLVRSIRIRYVGY